MIRALFILLFVAHCSIAGERVVAKFDSDKQSVTELLEIIEHEVKQGATVVRFPSGRWMWHDLSKLGLDPRADEDLAEIRIKYSETKLSKEVTNWLSRNEVKAVQIGLHGELPAEVFFRVEEILTKLKVPYVVFSGGVGEEGELRLIESDGSLHVIIPKDLDVSDYKLPNDLTFGSWMGTGNSDKGEAGKSNSKSESNPTSGDKPQPESEKNSR